MPFSMTSSDATIPSSRRCLATSSKKDLFSGFSSGLIFSVKGESISPLVIDWALKHARKTPENLKNTVSKRVQEWIDGKGKAPTVKQLERLAKATHVLVPCFFQGEPPRIPLQISDFRTFDSRSPAEPSPELYDVINLMLSRQDWLDDYLEDVGGETLDFVGSCKGIPLPVIENTSSTGIRNGISVSLWGSGM